MLTLIVNNTSASTITTGTNPDVPCNPVVTRELLLLSKTGKIKNGAGKNKEDVLGFEYLVHDDNSQCCEYYLANSTLVGIKKTEPVPCPCGIRAIKDYKITYAEAIEIFHSLNFGDTFTGIRLSWPLNLETSEPTWHIDTTLGHTLIIGANSGKPICISRYYHRELDRKLA
ncbi:MAG: hypothetical protein F6K21_06810 [Symploca sp. SIO2D2]|nr:hypothetical protein [Symploca sp. SIO2D2]